MLGTLAAYPLLRACGARVQVSARAAGPDGAGSGRARGRGTRGLRPQPTAGSRSQRLRQRRGIPEQVPAGVLGRRVAPVACDLQGAWMMRGRQHRQQLSQLVGP